MADPAATPSVSVENERLDDLPVIVNMLAGMGIPSQVDQFIKPHGNWQGVSVGQIVLIWLSYILTEADHRMNHVRDWVASRRHALEHLIGQEIRETDFTDDRLAEVVRYLSADSRWQSIERGISQQTIRVYELEPQTVRLDATVAQTYHDPSEHELFQVGRTKTNSYDVQFKLMLGSLDPMGMPLAVDVVSGEKADDPLYVPVYERIRRTLKKTGLLYVGDSKMGSLESRATIANQGDYYLMPLALVGTTPDLLEQALDRVEAGGEEVQEIYHPQDLPEAPSEQPAPNLALAQGFEMARECTATVGTEKVVWHERLFVLRSSSYAQAQITGFEERLARTTQRVLALTPAVGRGHKQYTEEGELQAAVQAILQKNELQDFFEVTLERQETTRHIRGYSGKPARTEVTSRYQVHVRLNHEAIARAKRRMGWRMYASNAPLERLSLSQAVLIYRDQYLVERNFGRLKGRPLGITPLYVERDDHALGLIRLLSLALRGLVLIEFVARRTLAVANQTLSGIYAGNPTRQTARPTAEKLLAAFQEITLSLVRFPGRPVMRQVTSLNPVQKTILGLLGLTENIYLELGDQGATA